MQVAGAEVQPAMAAPEPLAVHMAWRAVPLPSVAACSYYIQVSKV
jgi:hypothetical protein